jgi:hypothetical protein
MAYKWLQREWKVLFPALEQAVSEADVQRLCEAQIAGWRARPTLKKASSLRIPMTDTRNEIKVRLQGERQEWALHYLAFSEAEWVVMNAGSDDALQERHENQQFVKDPDAIVARATMLLASEHWYEIAAGLAVCTGRRLTEVLKTATFAPKSAYSVLFTGQLKAKGNVTFEIPTLAPASLVIEAIGRLRLLLETATMDDRDVSHKYSQPVREAAHRHFVDLVPVRAGNHDELYTHLFRSIYARIAVLYYCPMNVTDIHFMATIQGHYRLLESGSESERRNYASGAHYYDFKLVLPDGNIDGRQGTHLGMAGVELLDVFKPKLRKEMSVTSTKTETQEEMEARKKTGYSMIKPLKTTRARFDAAAARLGLIEHDDTLSKLLDIFEQGGAAQQAQVSPEQLVPADVATLVQQAMKSKGQDFQAFLIEALSKEAKFHLSLSKRHADKDFSTMTTAQLTNTKHPEATKERIRRAIRAIAKHNEQAEPMSRWYINATAVHKLVGGRFSIINEYFVEHQMDIDNENKEYDLTAAYNRKPISIDQVITVPEMGVGAGVDVTL